MASERQLAHYRQDSHRHFNICKSEDRSTSPTAEPETSLTRTSATPLFPQPPAPDLFNSLLFNRERVYQASSASLYSTTSRPALDESSSNARPTEAFRTIREVAQQSSPLIHAYGGKQQSREQNSMPDMSVYLKGDQVKPVSKRRGKSEKRIATKAKAKMKEDKPRKRSASRTICRASKSQKITPKLPASKPLEPVASSNDQSSNIMDYQESELDLQLKPNQNNLNDKTTRVSTEQLSQELEAVKADAKSVQRLCAQLQHDLKEEREALCTVVKERDHLRIEADISKSQHDELAAKYVDLQHEHERVQTSHEAMLEDITRAKDSEDDKHAQELKEQIEIAKDENSRLVRENEVLKAAASSSSSPHRATLSPAPSSVSSDKEKKTENIRRMYVKVKRRYDHLHKAANDISTCTRSIDLSCFGEFGQYLKHLRTALEEDSQEKQAVLVHEHGQDEK